MQSFGETQGKQLFETIEKTSKDQEEVLKRIERLLADQKNRGVSFAMQQVNQPGGSNSGTAPPARPDSERIDFQNKAHGSGRIN